MKPVVFYTLFASLILLNAPSSRVAAQSVEELKTEAQALMEKARDRKAEGRFDESQELAAKAKQIEIKAREIARQTSGNRPESAALGEKLAHLRAELKELEAADRKDEAAEMRRRIKKIMTALADAPERKTPEPRDDRERPGPERSERPPRERGNGSDRPDRQMEERMDQRRPVPHGGPLQVPGGDPNRRLRHVEKAIEHLRAAGLFEPAERLEQQFGRFHGEAPENGGMRRPMPPMGRQDGPPSAMAEMHSTLRELREQVDQMRRMIEETRGAMKRGIPDERPRDGR